MAEPRSVYQLFALLTMLSISCGPVPTENAQGSETTNGFYVSVVSSTVEGTASPLAPIYIFWSGRTPTDTGFAQMTLADTSGFFQFTDIPTGKYNLFAYPLENSLAAMVSGITVNSKGTETDSASFDTMTVVNGTVTRNDSVMFSIPVYMPGTPFQVLTDINGEFSFSNIPMGTYSLVASTQNRNTWEVLADTQTVDTRVSNSDHTTKLLLH